MNNGHTAGQTAARDEARRRLTTQVLGARALAEVLAATQALREWIQTYPEEREWMRDGFEQLSHMEDIARERAALPPEQTEMYHQRDHLMAQVQTAFTLPAVAAVLKTVDEWLAAHPEDEGMQAAHKQLIIMQELLAETTGQEARSLQHTA